MCALFWFQRCIQDLEERFAGVKVVVSPPILSFFETIVGPTTPAVVAGPAAYVRHSKRGDDAGDVDGVGTGTAAGPGSDAIDDKPASSYVDGTGLVHSFTADKSMRIAVRYGARITAVVPCFACFAGCCRRCVLMFTCPLVMSHSSPLLFPSARSHCL